MTDLYQIATGHDNEASFVTFSPQPMSRGIQVPETIYAASAVYPEGEPFLVIEFNNISPAKYLVILLAHGLTAAYSSVSALVTVRAIGYDRLTWANWNATVVHQKWDDKFYEFSLGVVRSAKFIYRGLIAT